MSTAAYTSFIPSECVKYILKREPVLYLANISFFGEEFHTLLEVEIQTRQDF